MTNRTSPHLIALALTGVLVLLGVLQGVLSAPARALTGTGHGPGYLSADGWWLGTYRLDDGSQGFCLNAGKQSPTGHTLDMTDGAALGWFSADQAARLAYISRSWAGTDDRLTAAAGQLATWYVAGLNGHTPESLAARAGADAGAVLRRAQEMVDEAGRLGSTGVRAAAVLELAETGPGRVRVEATVDRLTGSELLAPGAHQAVVTLTGATFADGRPAATIASGTDAQIVPSGDGTTVAVTASAVLDRLPYGAALSIAVPRDDAQAVLIAVPATAAADAGASVTGPSPLPFQPRVTTVTSAAHAVPGDQVTDHLTVGVDEGDGLLAAWGVRSVEDGFAPVEAIVESTLYGPFDAPIERAAAAPAEAPVVCTVETTVAGTGDYETPPCTLPAAGYYVWTERIDLSRTAPGAGGERLRAWQSDFGIASEITQAERPVAPAALPSQLAATGSEAAPALWLATGLVGSGAALTVIPSRRRRRHRR